MYKSQKTEEGILFKKIFCETNITLIPKLGKDITRKENCRTITLIDKDILKKSLTNLFNLTKSFIKFITAINKNDYTS